MADRGRDAGADGGAGNRSDHAGGGLVVGSHSLARVEYAVARLAAEPHLTSSLRSEVARIMLGERDGDVLAWEEKRCPASAGGALF